MQPDHPVTSPAIATALWWVIPGQLAGVRKPTPAEIPALPAAGIGAIVSLMDDPANLDDYAAAHLPYRWLPTQGGTAPTRAQVQDLRQFITVQQQYGRGVAIHCSSGNRRTGTMLAAYLLTTGINLDQALQRIYTANPQAELRPAQLDFLRDLAAHPICHNALESYDDI